MVDSFVRDRQAGTTERVSVASAGGEGDGNSRHPSLSSDGRLVAFESDAKNLVVGDGNGTFDVFVHDRQSGTTTLLSESSRGVQGDGRSLVPALAPDGRHVAFTSAATNLVAADSNGCVDVFVQGCCLTLEVDPPIATSGTHLRFSTWTGKPVTSCLLVVSEVNGTPTFLPAALSLFDAQGRWTIPVTVPPGLAGSQATFQTFGFVQGGRVDVSEPFAVQFQ
jgi:hypothetical protein